MRDCDRFPKGSKVSERKSTFIRALALMVLAAGLAALLFPPLRQAIGIDRPDQARFAAAQKLFTKALAGRAAPLLRQDAAAVGLVASSSPPDWPSKWPNKWQGVMLAEGEDGCEGRGTYLVRDGDEALPLAITAPHRGADRHTGVLAASLFLESGAAAAAWNSAPRNPRTECPHAIDLAREHRHPFTAFALAFARRHPDGLVVQLHGFERQARNEAAARGASVILSNGTRKADARLLDLADCLSLSLAPHSAKVFPDETGELGALANAQASALRKAGFAGFVHLELSAELRRELVSDDALRARFRGCLERAAQ